MDSEGWRIALDLDAAVPRQTQTDNAASGAPAAHSGYGMEKKAEKYR